MGAMSRIHEKGAAMKTDPDPGGRAVPALHVILADMQIASDLIDEANGKSEYQARLVALALIARHFLRARAAAPVRAPEEPTMHTPMASAEAPLDHAVAEPLRRLRALGAEWNRGGHPANLAEQIWDQCDALSKALAARSPTPESTKDEER
jgi:hypothetical protein